MPPSSITTTDLVKALRPRPRGKHARKQGDTVPLSPFKVVNAPALPPPSAYEQKKHVDAARNAPPSIRLPKDILPPKRKRGRPRKVKRKALARLLAQTPPLSIAEIAEELNVSLGAIYINIKRHNLDAPRSRHAASTRGAATQILTQFHGHITPGQLARTLKKTDSHIRLYLRRAINYERRQNPKIRKKFPIPWRLNLYKIQHLFITRGALLPPKHPDNREHELIEEYEEIADQTNLPLDRVRAYIERMLQYRHQQYRKLHPEENA